MQTCTAIQLHAWMAIDISVIDIIDTAIFMLW